MGLTFFCAVRQHVTLTQHTYTYCKYVFRSLTAIMLKTKSYSTLLDAHGDWLLVHVDIARTPCFNPARDVVLNFCQPANWCRHVRVTRASLWTLSTITQAPTQCACSREIARPCSELEVTVARVLNPNPKCRVQGRRREPHATMSQQSAGGWVGGQPCSTVY